MRYQIVCKDGEYKILYDNTNCITSVGTLTKNNIQRQFIYGFVNFGKAFDSVIFKEKDLVRDLWFYYIVSSLGLKISNYDYIQIPRKFGYIAILECNNKYIYLVTKGKFILHPNYSEVDVLYYDKHDEGYKLPKLFRSEHGLIDYLKREYSDCYVDPVIQHIPYKEFSYFRDVCRLFKFKKHDKRKKRDLSYFNKSEYINIFNRFLIHKETVSSILTPIFGFLLPIILFCLGIRLLYP